MWHVTCDTWHVTYDMLLGVNNLSKFQLPSSSGLWFMILWRLRGKGWLTDWLSNEAECRTAPATPGLLIMETFKILWHNFFSLTLSSNCVGIFKYAMWLKVVGLWNVHKLQKNSFYCRKQKGMDFLVSLNTNSMRSCIAQIPISGFLLFHGTVIE